VIPVLIVCYSRGMKHTVAPDDLRIGGITTRTDPGIAESRKPPTMHVVDDATKREFPPPRSNGREESAESNRLYGVDERSIMFYFSLSAEDVIENVDSVTKYRHRCDSLSDIGIGTMDILDVSIACEIMVDAEGGEIGASSVMDATKMKMDRREGGQHHRESRLEFDITTCRGGERSHACIIIGTSSPPHARPNEGRPHLKCRAIFKIINRIPFHHDEADAM
jgi:hypothetical protein